MKFIVAVVILVLAVCANAGLVPLGWGGAHYAGSPLAYTSHSTAWGAPWAAAPWAAAPWSGAPISYASHAHIAAPAVYAAPAIHHPIAHEGSYVAANRGSVHVAPLPGHTQSAASINLQPAPGTW